MIDRQLINEIKRFDKIVIVGFPKTGKTIISDKIFDDRKVVHTDDFIDKSSWDKAPEDIIRSVRDLDCFAIEGIQGMRVLRKGNRLGIFKADAIVYMKPKYEVMPEHESMRKGLTKIWIDFIKEKRYSVKIFKVTEDELI